MTKLNTSEHENHMLPDALLGAIIRAIYKFIAFWLVYYFCILILDLFVILPLIIISLLAAVPLFLLGFYSFFEYNFRIMGNTPFAALLALIEICFCTLIGIPVGLILGLFVGMTIAIGVWSMCFYALYNAAIRGWNLGTIETLQDIFNNVCAIPKYLYVVYIIAVTTYHMYINDIPFNQDIKNSLEKLITAEIDLYNSLGITNNAYLKNIESKLNSSTESQREGIYKSLIKNFGWQMLGCEPEENSEEQLVETTLAPA